MLGVRFSPGVTTVLAYAILFLPLFLWLGPMWLVFYWMALFFTYATKPERATIIILLLIAALFALPGLLFLSGFLDGPIYPLTSELIPVLEGTFTMLIIVIATYYGGELVWRDRERKINEIVDSTPLPDWAQMLPKLFHRFTQALPALERAKGGLGLGLPLVRGLVEMHGGEVSAHSEGPGRGSEFTVRLGVAPARAAPVASGRPAQRT